MRDAASWIFENLTLKTLNIPFKKVALPGRVKCGGTEGEIVVAHGRLPSPDLPIPNNFSLSPSPYVLAYDLILFTLPSHPC